MLAKTKVKTNINNDVNLKSEFDFINNRMKEDIETVEKTAAKNKAVSIYGIVDEELEAISIRSFEDNISSVNFFLEKDGILRITSISHSPMNRATYNPSVSEAIESLQNLEKAAIDLIKEFANSLK